MRFWLLLLVLLSGCLNQPERGVVSFYLGDDAFVTLESTCNFHEGNLVLKNGAEKIVLNRVEEGVYSVPVFGGSVVGVEREGGVFCGVWTDSLRPNNYTIPLEIRPTPLRKPCGEPRVKSTYDTSLGILSLESFCDSVLGTFLTPTGDYRYLSGSVKNSVLNLNTFCGSHLFSFNALIKGDSLVNGVFRSGNHYTEMWDGVKNNNAVPGWLSSQKPNEDFVFKFTATNLDGKKVVINRETLVSSGKNVLVMDVLGTWCPNCYDEVLLLKEMVEKHPNAMFLSVAFERSENPYKRISEFKKEMGVDWSILYGGIASKVVADSVLPFLGGVKSFPTTLFLPISGDPIIHKGFNGPATHLYPEEVEFYHNSINGFNE